MVNAKFGILNNNDNLNDAKLKKLTANIQLKMIEIKLAQGFKLGKEAFYWLLKSLLRCLR